jgi:hypothetical protein
VCALHTATGDDAARRAGFYAAVAGAGWRPVAPGAHPDAERRRRSAHLLEQDVVWVGGGSVAALMVVWRLHGPGRRAARGVGGGRGAHRRQRRLAVLAHRRHHRLVRPRAAALDRRPRLVPASTCPHYDSEQRRRPLYQRLVREGALDPGVATDDGVGLHYTGDGVLHEVVADRPGAYGWRVDRDGETKLEPRVLR